MRVSAASAALSCVFVFVFGCSFAASGVREVRDGAVDSGLTGSDACPSPCCGNGVIEAGEECDGAELGVDGNGEPLSCQSLGYHDGSLGCTDFCRFDTSDCLEQICGGQVAHDLSGDFIPDLAVGAPASTTTRLLVFAGGALATYETAFAGAPADLFGGTLAHARDLTGDGFGDLVVGVGWIDGVTPPGGFVNVYFSGGCPPGPLLPAGPDVVLLGGADETFGAAVADAGDLDGNGHGDLIVGAPGTSATDGRAYVFLGNEVSMGVPAAVLTSPGYGYFFGSTVAGGGDTSGDGSPDVAVGMVHRVYEGALQEGHVHVFNGTAGGVPDSTADAILWPSLGVATSVDELFGIAISFIGDFNADGVGDLAVGAPGPVGADGIVYVYWGPVASGGTAVIGAPGARVGYSLEALGDLNADGYADFAAGAPGADGGAGAVYVIPANFGAVPVPVILGVPGTTALGRALGAVDFDGDGAIDLAASADGLGGDGVGRVYVWTSVGLAVAGTPPAITLVGAAPGDGFGAALD